MDRDTGTPGPEATQHPHSICELLLCPLVHGQQDVTANKGQ